MGVAEDIVEKIKSNFDLLEEPTNIENRVLLKISPEKIRDLALYVRNELGFTFGNMAFGTDLAYGKQPVDEFEMSWYVGRPDTNILLVLRTNISRNEAKVTSLSDLWTGFNWHEREAYDLLGIEFEGHPDLRRIYLPDNWEGFPLREDYVYRRPKYHKPEDEE